MRDSIIIVLFFIAGIISAFYDLLPKIIIEHDPTLPALWLLMGLVGLSLGSDARLVEILKSIRPSILLLPLATIAGTFTGAACSSILLPWSLPDCLAVSAGFGYYSLSSIFISQYKGPDLGAMALIANILREIITLIATPLLIKFFGPTAAISCGGATSMDTTLPIITRYAGINWVFPSIFHAVILDFSVPFWVTLFCSI